MKQLLLAILAMLFLQAAMADDTRQANAAALWAGLRDGSHVALMRHAMAPGVGDPDGFRLGDCATQRNLSADGKRQAARTGDLFRHHGITQATVYSSQWCRCLDTANGLGLGSVTPLPALNSFFGNRSAETLQSARVMDLIRQHVPGTALVLVTHQVNITALTGNHAESGEIVVVRAQGDKLEVAGRLRTRP